MAVSYLINNFNFKVNEGLLGSGLDEYYPSLEVLIYSISKLIKVRYT
jgi:hypothetical protein